MITKDVSQPFSIQAWNASAGPPGRPMFFFRDYSQGMLSLLLVNKQIYEEAYMLFYYLNTFYFRRAQKLEDFLQVLPPSRRQHLAQIAFKYTPVDANWAAAALSSVASLPKLRKLYIEIDEPYWREHNPVGEYPKPDEFDPLKIPGIQALRSVRVLDEVVFSGDCPTITAYLKPEMERRWTGIR